MGVVREVALRWCVVEEGVLGGAAEAREGLDNGCYPTKDDAMGRRKR